MPAPGCRSIRSTRRTRVVTGHDAVGVEHHHVGVARSPAPAEVGDVAALAAKPHAPAAVEDAPEAVDGATPLGPRLLLAHDRLRVGAVAQHEEMKLARGADPLERVVDGAQTREDAIDRLVADRHDDGGRLGGHGEVGLHPGRARDREAVAADETIEAHQGRPEADRDPAEEHAEDDDDDDLEGGAAAARQHVHHEPARDHGRQEDQRRQQQPAAERGARPRQRPPLAAEVETRAGEPPASEPRDQTTEQAPLHRLGRHAGAADRGHRVEAPVPYRLGPSHGAVAGRVRDHAARETPCQEGVGAGRPRAGRDRMTLEEQRAERRQRDVDRIAPLVPGLGAHRPRHRLARQLVAFGGRDPECREVRDGPHVGEPPVLQHPMGGAVEADPSTFDGRLRAREPGIGGQRRAALVHHAFSGGL